MNKDPEDPNFAHQKIGELETQLSQQTELLRRAREIVKERVESNPWPPEKGGFARGCQFCGKPYPQPFSNAEEHYDSCSWQKAQTLLPELEKALEEGV